MLLYSHDCLIPVSDLGMNDSPVGVTPRSFLPKVWVTPPGVNDSLYACLFVPDPANVDLFPSSIVE